MDKLEQMLEKQRNFTELFYQDKFNKPIKELTPKELLQASRDLTLQLIVECTEVLSEIKGWKTHRANNDEIDIEKLKEELIDVLKFHFNFLILFNISADEVFNSFINKSNIVEQRYNKEKSNIK